MNIEHLIELEERRERQFAIVRRGLREAARVLAEMEASLAELEKPVYETIEESIERVDEVADQYPEDELTLEFSVPVEEVIEVSDEMIVSESEYLGEPEKELSVLDKLESFLAGVHRRQFIRDTF